MAGPKVSASISPAERHRCWPLSNHLHPASAGVLMRLAQKGAAEGRLTVRRAFSASDYLDSAGYCSTNSRQHARRIRLIARPALELPEVGVVRSGIARISGQVGRALVRPG